jgi:cell wall-associated NlpC family hydrolase
VHRSILAHPATVLALSCIAPMAPLATLGAQRSDVSLSPFVSFLPATGASPLAGLAITLAGNGGLALRASGHLSLENTNNGALNATNSLRPWGGDADAVLFLGGRYLGGYDHTLSPYVFTGVGLSGRDSVGSMVTKSNWSYGAGLNVPLASVVDLFGEWRGRMSEFVLPTAANAAAPTSEIRVGLSFHFGGGGVSRGSRSTPSRASRRSSTTSGIIFPAPTTTSANAARTINNAEQYIGTPYVFGGTTPRGFDCSGFTQYVFARQGVRLPRTAAEQAQVGTALPAEWRAIAAGDLVMFAERERIDHVAIYAGHNRIIHSTSSGGGVRYDDLTTQRGQWFVDHMVAARRVTGDPSGLLLDLARGFNELGVQLDPPDRAPRVSRF